MFGNVFGNTVYSASLVIAVFMLGLGAGSYIAGGWADRRYRSGSESLLPAYATFELAIGGLGFGLSVLLPHLGQASTLVSAYTRDANGWYSLSATSYLARAGMAVVLLAPITLLMGGTLTLVIRHLVKSHLETAGWRIAVLYAANTAGAALGCVLTDFLLVPASGLRGAQMVAVFFNVIAAGGALVIARRERSTPADADRKRKRPQPSAVGALRSGAIPLTSLALALSGFGAMGMEIVWFRHLSILLGGFRAVFSLLLTVVLVGIGAGALVSGVLSRRSDRPAEWWMLGQGLFVAVTLLGLAAASANAVDLAVAADRAHDALPSGVARTLTELWFNTHPMLLEAGLPALLMGLSFPLANALIQRTETSVGRRAGVLYLSNTVGAVCGSLATGFLLLPLLGIQGAAALLTIAALLAAVPLCFVQARPATGWGRTAPMISMSIGGIAAGLWLLLPPAYVIARAVPTASGDRVIAQSEGLTEVITVTDASGKGRTLVTNGHPMSSTTVLAQRYMRALSHIPLLAMDRPETVLVIGFGVGNTTHAATLHPSIRRVEVADLSRAILSSAGYFSGVNRDVLNDPRVAVYVNDGRQHLQMQRGAAYDLITLEPPPIGYAGVAALYSTEFYALARTRLRPKGYISQWLPAYQVPSQTTLAMIRAFIDVFPQAVLISGSEAELLLVGTNDSVIEIDPEPLAAALAAAPAARADLQRLDLGTVREIAGAFVGSAQTLAAATRDTLPVTDDRPIQEYGVISLLDSGEGVPGSVVDLGQVASWCPKCFVDGKTAPSAAGLDLYLALLNRAYAATPSSVGRSRISAAPRNRVLLGSAYLGAIVPDSADVHNVLGIGLAQQDRVDEAITEFREALQRAPDSAETHWHLGAALAYRGARDEAIVHLRRSVEIDPSNPQSRHDLDVVLSATARASPLRERR